MRQLNKWMIPGLMIFLLVLVVKPALAHGPDRELNRFGYGIRLNPSDPQFGKAVERANRLQFDWVAVDYRWAAHQPHPDQDQACGELSQAMDAADRSGLSVMISITEAPVWALTGAGPSTDKTVQLVQQLTGCFPGVIKALELFPGPNTKRGWGAEPDPGDYGLFFSEIQQTLEAAEPELMLITGGLVPVDEFRTLDHVSDQVPDDEFLERLYRGNYVLDQAFIGIRLPVLSETRSKESQGSAGAADIRHYEQIRKVMLENDHREGLIWITGFANPQGLDPLSQEEDREKISRWLQETYLLIRSQLYIQAAFFAPDDSVNRSLFVSPGESYSEEEITIFIPTENHPRENARISGDRKSPLGFVISKKLTDKHLTKKTAEIAHEE